MGPCKEMKLFDRPVAQVIECWTQAWQVEGLRPLVSQCLDALLREDPGAAQEARDLFAKLQAALDKRKEAATQKGGQGGAHPGGQQAQQNQNPQNPQQTTQQTKQAQQLLQALQGLEKGQNQQALQALLQANLKQAPRPSISSQLSASALPGGLLAQGGGANLLSGMGKGETKVKNEAKLILSNYRLQPDQPKVGEAFTLTLSLTNTNAKRTIQNIRLKLASKANQTEAGGLSLTGMTQAPASASSIFLPVDSANTFYVERIAPRKTATLAVKLRTLPELSAQSYPLSLSMDYEDQEGNAYTAEETMAIALTQEAKLLLGQVGVGEAEAGQPLSIDLDFFNTGRDKVTNLLVDVVSDQLKPSAGSRYFLGSLGPGQSDHYTVDLVPLASGPLKGEVVVRFEDAQGKVHSEKAAFSTSVAKAGEGRQKTGQASREAGQGRQAKGASLLPWILFVLILLALGAGLLFRRRRRRLEKQAEELTLHEK